MDNNNKFATFHPDSYHITYWYTNTTCVKEKYVTHLIFLPFLLYHHMKYNSNNNNINHHISIKMKCGV